MLGDSMFYGSGAGKLPTASAVVADVVDIVRHKGKHITIQWDREKLELADHKKLSSRFFVRTTADHAAVEAAFGSVSYVTVEGVSGETAFVTEEMDEYAYEAAAGKLDHVLQCIRVK